MKINGENMKLQNTGVNMIGETENYRKRTLDLIKILLSKEFKEGKITKYAITHKMGYPVATVNYHFLRIYNNSKFRSRYLSTGKKQK